MNNVKFEHERALQNKSLRLSILVFQNVLIKFAFLFFLVCEELCSMVYLVT